MMQLSGRGIVMYSVFLLIQEEMSGLEYNEIVRKTFGSETEGYQFYNKYAKGKGFSVTKSYCEWSNSHDERTLRSLFAVVKVSVKRRR
jgi:hypothetical protein